MKTTMKLTFFGLNDFLLIDTRLEGLKKIKKIKSRQNRLHYNRELSIVMLSHEYFHSLRASKKALQRHHHWFSAAS
jgi:hypothetical protein